MRLLHKNPRLCNHTVVITPVDKVREHLLIGNGLCS